MDISVSLASCAFTGDFFLTVVPATTRKACHVCKQTIIDG